MKHEIIEKLKFIWCSTMIFLFIPGTLNICNSIFPSILPMSFSDYLETNNIYLYFIFSVIWVILSITGITYFIGWLIYKIIK